VLNKRTIESLIKAGAFDSLGHPRKGLLMVYETIIDATVARRRERDQGVMSLFGDVGGDDSVFSEKREIPALQFDKAEQLKFEKEMLGLYVSDHPLMGIEGALRRRVDASIAEAVEREDNSFFTIGGIISALNRKYTRKGDLMATFMLEDLQGAVEVAVFPKTFQRYGHQLADDVIITVKGRLNKQDETRVSFMATDIVVQEGLRASGDSLHIKVSAQALTPELIEDMKGVLQQHPGSSPVFVHLGGDKVMQLDSKFTVDLDRVIGQIRVMFGEAAYIE
jgi:DNA polymerase-3 subunit alpha